jgi:hypothetical protein
MDDLNIEELRDKKEKLEKNMEKLMIDFMEETDMLITGLALDMPSYIREMGFRDKAWVGTFRVEIKVEL